jgi:uncharacterized membrane protein YczE
LTKVGGNMKRILVLMIAVLLNAFGQSLMAQTEFGMTAWGMAAVNFEAFTGISLGLSFVILSTLSYLVAVLIRKKIDHRECIESFLFLFAFGFLTDVFVSLIPNISEIHILLRFIYNFIGLLILLFSISLHLKVNRAIHPMDVYLREIQDKVKSVRIGTYISYGSAFILGITFGILNGRIEGINIGTVYTLLLSGVIFGFYTNTLLKNVKFNS